MVAKVISELKSVSRPQHLSRNWFLNFETRGLINVASCIYRTTMPAGLLFILKLDFISSWSCLSSDIWSASVDNQEEHTQSCVNYMYLKLGTISLFDSYNVAACYPWDRLHRPREDFSSKKVCKNFFAKKIAWTHWDLNEKRRIRIRHLRYNTIVLNNNIRTYTGIVISTKYYR